VEDTFTCRDCGTPDLPVSESVKDASRKRGIMERCYPCDRDRAAARRADPEKGEKQRTAVRESVRKMRAEGRQKPPTEAQLAAKREQQKLAARAKAYAKIGATDEDYWSQLEAQGGKCAICPRTIPTHGDERFCYDHDHKTGKKRGLLCRYCNMAIGYLADDVERVKAALAYLESWKVEQA